MATKRVAQIRDGVVANMIVCDLSYPLGPDEVEVDASIGVGFVRAGEVFVPPAPEPWRMSPLEFLGRFTAEERAAANTMALSNPAFGELMGTLYASLEVRQDDPRTAQALDAFTFAGVLAPGRKDEILNG